MMEQDEDLIEVGEDVVWDPDYNQPSDLSDEDEDMAMGQHFVPTHRRRTYVSADEEPVAEMNTKTDGPGSKDESSDKAQIDREIALLDKDREIALLDKEHNLVKSLKSLMINDKMADVYFLVPICNTIGMESIPGDHRIPGHRLLLSVRSEVFERMFYGMMSESSNPCPEIRLPDIEFNGFRSLLKYLYTDEVDIGPENVISASYAAKKYFLDKLASECDRFLKYEINPRNLCTILYSAIIYNDTEYVDILWSRLDEMTKEALDDESFLQVPRDFLIQLLSKDRLSIAEVDLFKAVIRSATLLIPFY